MNDFTGAIKAGYTNDDINTKLGTTNVDYEGAVKAGYNNDDILAQLNKMKPTEDIEQVDMSTKQAPIPSEDVVSQNGDTSASKNQFVEAIKRGGEPYLNQLQQIGNSIGGTLEDAYNLVTNSDASYYENQRQRLQEQEQNIDTRLDPQGKAIAKPSTMAEVGIGLVTGGIKDPKRMVGAEGLLGYGAGYEDEGDVVQGIKSGIVQASIAAPFAGATPDKLISPLSDEAKTVAKKIGISNTEAIKLVDGLEKSEQAFELAKRGGAKTKGLMEGAFKDSTKAKEMYLEELSARRQAILESSGASDYNRVKNATKREFTTMKEYVDNISASAYDTSKFVDELETLKKTGSKTDATDRNIQSMIDNINENPTKSAGELVELRAEINHELSKATGERAMKWKAFKNDLDKFMKGNIEPKVFEMIETSTDSYRRMKQQGELLELITKAQKVEGVNTKGEVGAIDWSKLEKSLKESGLSSPEVNNAISLTKKFNKKFGDMDANLFGKSLPTPKSDTIQTFTSDPKSALQVLANRTGVSWLMRQFDADKSAQKAIADSMEKSNTQAEFFRNVIDNKNTPQRVKAEMKELLKGVADITQSNIQKQKVVSVAKQKQARLIQTRVNSADLAVQKQEDRLFQMEERLSKMESRAIDKPSDALDARIQRLEKEIELNNKDLEIKVQKHSQLKDDYDKLQVEIEDMNLFNPMRPKANKPKVSTKQ